MANRYGSKAKGELNTVSADTVKGSQILNWYINMSSAYYLIDLEYGLPTLSTVAYSVTDLCIEYTQIHYLFANSVNCNRVYY